MNAIQISYEEARNLMQPGDVIAFSGKGNISELVKMVTLADVSHVGVILQTKVVDDETGRFFNQVIESTTLKGCKGVRISRLSDYLRTYEGEVWWLPLDKKIRECCFNQKEFYDFLFQQNGKPYDTLQAINSAVDVLDWLGATLNQEDFSKFFCSELVAAAFEQAGAVGPVNASEVTPIDLCRWRIYEDTYYQIQGDPRKSISQFNTVSPSDWNIEGQQTGEGESVGLV